MESFLFEELKDEWITSRKSYYKNILYLLFESGKKRSILTDDRLTMTNHWLN